MKSLDARRVAAMRSGRNDFAKLDASITGCGEKGAGRRSNLKYHCGQFWWMYLFLVIAVVLVTALPITLTSRSQPLGNTPVIKTNFQDPCLAGPVDGVWYAFAGANGNPPGINVQMATSTDFSHWTLHDGHDAMPALAIWASTPDGHIWAPDVNQAPDGTWVMYFSAQANGYAGKHCTGAATSSNITGPYTAINDTISCALQDGGTIDPDGFQDPVSGNYYVVYKQDGNSIGSGGACQNSIMPNAPTPLNIIQVKSDLTTLAAGGFGTTLLMNEEEDGSNIEAPALIYHDGTYFLIYNSGCYVQPGYTVRYATTTDLFNKPFVRVTEPLINTGDTKADVQVPGAVDVSRDGTKLIFHGNVDIGSGKRNRGMYAANLEYGKGGTLKLGGLY